LKSKFLIWTSILILLAITVTGCASGSKTSENNSSNAGSKEAAKLDWPKKPITILVWSKAGSGVDVMGRQAAKFLEKKLGQPVVVENNTGGDGAAAMQAIRSKPADGYTIGVNTRSQMISLNTDLKNQFKLDDFQFISINEGDPYALVVLPNTGLDTLEDIAKNAKASGSFPIGGFGANSAHQIFTQDLAKAAGFSFEWIPYAGGSEAVTQLLGGHIKAALTNVGQVLEHVKAGKMKIVAVSTAKRMNELPDTPTFNELGFPELESSHWRGFYVKNGTPKEIIAKYDELFKELSEDEEWKKYLEANGLTNDFMPSSESQPFVQKEFEVIGKKLAGK
jgi:tripartite-type tricarboxylate transporter receptor subunit TctC